MTVTITIRCDNAAFDDDRELSRILLKLSIQAETGGGRLENGYAIMDFNGNRVGAVTVSE